MKKLFLIYICVIISTSTFSQITINKTDGGSVVTKLSMGIKVNKGSTLTRERFTINDANCPIQLNDIGIETLYNSPGYRFKPVGELTANVPVVAYEFHHFIYDVFGEHMKTLSQTEVLDIDGLSEFDKYGGWYASENNVSEYLFCISYVAKVRTKDGVLWNYDFKAIKEQLNKLKISFEEDFLPKKNKEDDK